MKAKDLQKAIRPLLTKALEEALRWPDRMTRYPRIEGAIEAFRERPPALSDRVRKIKTLLTEKQFGVAAMPKQAQVELPVRVVVNDDGASLEATCPLTLLSCRTPEDWDAYFNGITSFLDAALRDPKLGTLIKHCPGYELDTRVFFTIQNLANDTNPTRQRKLRKWECRCNGYFLAKHRNQRHCSNQCKRQAENTGRSRAPESESRRRRHAEAAVASRGVTLSPEQLDYFVNLDRGERSYLLQNPAVLERITKPLS